MFAQPAGLGIEIQKVFRRLTISAVANDTKPDTRAAGGKPKGLLRWIIPGAEILLVCILAYLAAGLVYQFMSDAGGVPVLRTASAPTRGEQVGEGTYIRFDPFYRSVGNAEATGVATNEALPESSLNIEVYGLRAERGGQGSAILKLQGSEQKLVAVGENIATGVRLTGVFPDRLELSRAGTREAVYLKPAAARPAQQKTKPGQGTRAAATGPLRAQGRLTVESRQRQPSASGKVLEQLRKLGLQPVRRNRRIIGFQLPEKLPQVAAVLGFEAGDVLMSVNGEPLTSFERLSELEDELGGAATLNVEIERRGELRRVALGLLGS